ncbi:Structural maintenance of chromosomes protein 3 [Rhodotorula toruloides]
MHIKASGRSKCASVLVLTVVKYTHAEPEGTLAPALPAHTTRVATRLAQDIQGFKSYRDETVVDPFSSGLNLLVGRNGSGKSNFFSAIRFVLSDAYTSLSREERQALLHEGGGGPGGATMSAFVEIEFDNSDGRFPTNKPTLLLRRTIGLKKDEYQLDRKSTSKGEVMSLLESAGFSRSNPYYIVPQGRITHLTNQKDADRLLLLKEVAGTKVYEDRRAESTKIMDETNAKRDKIKDLLDYIQERLNELEEEKDELKQFQTHDRARRSLEYSIYQRELKDVGDALDQIEEERRRDVDNANSKREEFIAREKELSNIHSRLSNLREMLSALATEHSDLSTERRDLTKRRTQVDCLVRDAEDASRSSAERKTELEDELEHVEKECSEKENELEREARPRWESKRDEEEAVKEELEGLQVTLRGLYAKQARRGQFRTKQERDSHLDGLVKRNEEVLQTRKRREEALLREREATERELADVQGRRKEMRQEVDSRKERTRQVQNEFSRLKEQFVEKNEQRKDLWKSESKLDAQSRHAHEQLKGAERTISTTMDRDTANGLRAARAIADELGLDGFYGPLYELFEVEERYKTAVEVTAGTSLFQIVVDNDDTATRILDRMVQDKSGRVTFMPLNRLRVHDVEYPKSNEAIPMINKLKFSEDFRPAFKQVFGRTIICQTLEIAGAYTRSHGLNAITLDGDKYDRKGSLTGGYHDVRRSRLDAVKLLKAAQKKDEELSAQRSEIKTTLVRLEQEITQLVGKIKVAEGSLTRLRDEHAPFLEATMQAQAEEDRLKTKLAKLDMQLAEHRSNMRSLEKECEMWSKEMQSAFEGQEGLSAEEEDEMTRLSVEVERRKKALVDLSKEVSKLASRKDLLAIELNENLRRRREDTRARIDALDALASGQYAQVGAGGAEELKGRKNELKKLDEQIDSLNSRLSEIDEETDKVNKETADLEKEKERRDTQQADDQRGIARQQKNVERYLAKRQVLLQRKDECNKNIRDLGVLPEEAFAETTASSEKLLKKLRKVNEALKGFAHVNKKAYEQYTSFTKQRDELLARQKELDVSQQSIAELIDVLDARKDEAIERTFKQVAKSFAEVFEKLVPSGRGRLIMLERQQEKADDEMDVDEPEEDGGVENYTGVAIRVSFKSKSNEGLRLQQLSGGQKALVALALIFSIQKCDPAPFYLFDEIDANLDADRRTAVAAMIGELAQEAQYICTTFRAELIPHADAYFGVVFNQAKISNVKTLTADECSTFIDAAEQVRA